MNQACLWGWISIYSSLKTGSCSGAKWWEAKYWALFRMSALKIPSISILREKKRGKESKREKGRERYGCNMGRWRENQIELKSKKSISVIFIFACNANYDGTMSNSSSPPLSLSSWPFFSLPLSISFSSLSLHLFSVNSIIRNFDYDPLNDSPAHRYSRMYTQLQKIWGKIITLRWAHPLSGIELKKMITWCQRMTLKCKVWSGWGVHPSEREIKLLNCVFLIIDVKESVNN